MKKNNSVDPMNLAGLAVLAVVKIIVALVLARIGLGLFGWGLIGCAYILAGHTSVAEFFGLMLLIAFSLYVCLASAICLFLSIFLKKQYVDTTARWLIALFLIIAAVLLVCAYIKGSLAASPVEFLLAIFLILLVMFLYLLVFRSISFTKNTTTHTSSQTPNGKPHKTPHTPYELRHSA